jgi:hypothetical protein
MLNSTRPPQAPACFVENADYHCSFSPKSKNDLSARCPARVRPLGRRCIHCAFRHHGDDAADSLLNEAAQGSIEPDAVAALLGFAALNYLPPLLSLSMFVAILLTLSRGYRDSEMVVWFSSGLSLTAWIRPVVTFAVPLVRDHRRAGILPLAVGVVRERRVPGKLSTRKDAGQVSPGAFQESSAGDRVVFVEGSLMTPVTFATCSSAKRARAPGGHDGRYGSSGDRGKR